MLHMGLLDIQQYEIIVFCIIFFCFVYKFLPLHGIIIPIPLHLYVFDVSGLICTLCSHCEH